MTAKRMSVANWPSYLTVPTLADCTGCGVPVHGCPQWVDDERFPYIKRTRWTSDFPLRPAFEDRCGNVAKGAEHWVGGVQ